VVLSSRVPSKKINTFFEKIENLYTSNVIV